MKSSSSIALVNTSSPFSSSNAKDSLDIALIMGSYEQDVSLYFAGEGVWQLIDGQSPETLHVKNFLKTFSAFEFYDLNHVYVCSDSLKQRGLSANFHIDNVTVLNKTDFSMKLHQHSVVLKF